MRFSNSLSLSLLMATLLAFFGSLTCASAQDDPFADPLPVGFVQVDGEAIGVDFDIFTTADGHTRVYQVDSLDHYGSLIDYLQHGHAQQQIEFSKDQKAEFKEISSEYKSAIKDLYKKYPELKDKNLPSAKRNKINKTVQLEGKKLREEFNEKAKEILVPHQVKTLDSLRFKRMVQATGFKNAITQKPFKEVFDITREQDSKLQELEKEAQKKTQKAYEELQLKLQEIQAKSKKEMLKALTTEQRRKINELESQPKKK